MPLSYREEIGVNCMNGRNGLSRLDEWSRTSRFTMGWLALVFLMLMPRVGHGQSDLDYWKILAMDRAAYRVPTFAVMPAQNEPGQNIVYGDRYAILHVVYITDNSADELWRSPTLDGEVYEVLVEDLDGNGTSEIICRTRGGRIYVYDDLFNVRYENLREDYSEISAMTIANVDDDAAYEIVVLAGNGIIDYIDGAQFSREYRSTQSYRATEMIVGNVDNDAQLEIIFNSGMVVDASAGDIEWRASSQFGDHIELFDIDGDGIDEVIGYRNNNQPVSIFDVDEQQEKPLR